MRCPGESPEISDEGAECCYDWLSDEPCDDCPLWFGPWGAWRAIVGQLESRLPRGCTAAITPSDRENVRRNRRNRERGISVGLIEMTDNEWLHATMAGRSP